MKETGNAVVISCKVLKADSVVFWSVLFFKNFCSSLQQPLPFPILFSIPQLPQVLELICPIPQSASLPMQ